jgi:peroxiredoxin
VADELSVGDVAPNFSLARTGDGVFTLSEQLGEPMILAFYPEDFSPVCTAQLMAYAGAQPDFSALGVSVFGISPQPVSTHEDFAHRIGLNFPLLADEEKEVARLYGVLGPLGFYRRSVFVIDRTGRIVYAHRSRAGMSFRGSDELLRVVRESCS